MSARNLLAGAVALFAMASPALAQDTSPWDLRERNAYVLDMQGKMWSTRVGDKGMTMMMRHARAVPRGTVFFTSNGKALHGPSQDVRPRRWLHRRRRHLKLLRLPARADRAGNRGFAATKKIKTLQ
jgi:hypothetical protein